MARSYWFISILIIILTIRCCSLIGPLCNRSVVMLFDQKHRCFRNFDFVVSIDVIRMNSYVDDFFNLTRVTLRIIINKVEPGPKQEPVLFQRRVLKLPNSENKQACRSLSSSLILRLPVPPMYSLPHLLVIL